MRLIEADKVKQVIKDYWKAQVNKALTLTADVNEANKRINSYLEHNHDLLEAIDELPSAQPEHCGDAVSRNAIVQKLNKMDRYVSTELRLCDTDKKFPQNEVFIVDDVYEGIVEQLPSAQPKRTCVNCGRTINNGGWYADGGTRCPIEEHYALPKDGYCHLWEKRNVTDDDYPERRTDAETEAD